MSLHCRPKENEIEGTPSYDLEGTSGVDLEKDKNSETVTEKDGNTETFGEKHGNREPSCDKQGTNIGATNETYVDEDGECNSESGDSSSEAESYNDSEFDEKEDDMYYDTNVDVDAEYAGVSTRSREKGKAKQKAAAKKKTVEWSVGIPKEVLVAEEEYDSDDRLKGYVSDKDDKRPKGKLFDPKVDMDNPKFEVLMQFQDNRMLQNAVKRHAIKEGRQITFVKQSRHRVKAVCKHPCKWMIYASKHQHETQLIVKTFHEEHTCARHYACTHLTANWLSERYLEDFRENKRVSAASIKKKVWKDYSFNITNYKVYRAREKAAEVINGMVLDQYSLLWDYAEELRRRNPGSTVVMKLVDGSMEIGCPRFERFYVCLQGLKEGFKHCRPFLSVDGCFLKGEYGGHLLVASGIDPNNNWYPVAYAVVEQETKATWGWFMSLVIEDLEIVNDYAFILMSDKQKGLIDAVKTLLPNAEHRFCVLHMLANMRTAGFKGVTYREYLWNAAKATTVNRFRHWMEQIAEHDIKAFHWFDDKSPANWSRSAFNTYGKCEILLNNLSESFNAHILDARDMPILSCLEEIRRLIMVRLEDNWKIAASKWNNALICPKIFKELEKRKAYVNECIPSSCGGSKYQVSCMYNAQYSVNLQERVCTCRKWDLSGIPCSHAISCIYLREEDAQQYVHEFYKTETYKAVYKFMINPMDGPEMWPKSGFQPVLPPIVVKKPGRPRKMRRRTTFDKEKKNNGGEQPPIVVELEDGTKKAKRSVYQKSLRCSVCKVEGHNKRSCPIAKQQRTESAMEEPTPVQTQVNAEIETHPEVENQTGPTPVQTEATPVQTGPTPIQTEPNQMPQQLNAEQQHDTRRSPRKHLASGSNVSQSQPRRSPRKHLASGSNVRRGKAAKSLHLSQPPPVTDWNSTVGPPPLKPVQVSSQPPPGVMQMLVPTGRELYTSNPSFACIKTASEQQTPAVKDAVIVKGGKSFVTMPNLKAETKRLLGEADATKSAGNKKKKMNGEGQVIKSQRLQLSRWLAPKEPDNSVYHID